MDRQWDHIILPMTVDHDHLAEEMCIRDRLDPRPRPENAQTVQRV